MEKKRIIIKYAGPIPELGNILGPILHPYNEKVTKIGELVTSGRKVFELNPKDPEDMVQLTIKNYKTDNFAVPAKAAETTPPLVAPKKPDPTPGDTTNPTGSQEASKTVEQKVVDVAGEIKKTDTTQKSDFTKK